MPEDHRLPHRVIGILAWTGTTLLLLRSIASIIQSIYLLVVGRFSWRILGIWEPWFYLGATLFALSTWHYTSERRKLRNSAAMTSRDEKTPPEQLVP
jgi:hypothetical protein